MASSSAAASGRRAPTGALAGAEKHDRRGVPPSPPCAACYTRGTRTTFAEIGHQVVVPAVIAPGPGKAVRKDAAFQILAKGLADVGLGGVVVPRPSNWPALASSSQVSKCSAIVLYSRVRSGWRGLWSLGLELTPTCGPGLGYGRAAQGALAVAACMGQCQGGLGA
jgi:hypothetical protein